MYKLWKMFLKLNNRICITLGMIQNWLLDLTSFSWSHWLPRWCGGKESACHCRRHKRCGFDPWVRKIPWSRKWQLTSVFLPGKFRGQRSLAGYSPWGCTELDRTEHTRLCILSPPFSFFWLLFLLKFYLFIYFWLCWVFTAACGRL